MDILEDYFSNPDVDLDKLDNHIKKDLIMGYLILTKSYILMLERFLKITL